MYIYVNTYIYTYIHTHTSAYLGTYQGMFLNRHIFMCIYTYMYVYYVYLNVCVCVCVWVYTRAYLGTYKGMPLKRNSCVSPSVTCLRAILYKTACVPRKSNFLLHQHTSAYLSLRQHTCGWRSSALDRFHLHLCGRYFNRPPRGIESYFSELGRSPLLHLFFLFFYLFSIYILFNFCIFLFYIYFLSRTPEG